MGLSNQLSCEAGSFSCCLNPYRFFTARGFEAFFPCAGTLGCAVCLTPQLFFPVYSHANVGLLAVASPTRPSIHCLARCPLCPGCPSPPHFPVWMNVSSLAPWFSDFHRIWFSGSSDYFLFLNLLSFFLLCEEAQCIYLCLYRGRKANNVHFN